MKNVRRVQFLLFLSLFIFSACLKQNELEVVSNDSFFVTEKTSSNIVKSASEYDYPPLSIVTEGFADGFSVELLKATLQAVDMNVDFYVGPWAQIKTDLAKGRIDVLPLVGRTPEREKLYDFTVPYISIYGNIFVRRNNINIKSLSDLQGKEILVMAGDNAEEFVKRENVSDKIISVESYEKAFTLLSSGEYDAIITQDLVGKQLINKLNINNVISVSEINSFKQDFTFAVQKGNSELLAKLNNGLSKIISNGTFDIIYNKWIAPVIDGDRIVDEKFIKESAKKVSTEVNNYILSHPYSTIEDLQNDVSFKSIAVHAIGDEGYTGIIDSESGYFYFHPQVRFINTDSHLLKDKLPDLWGIFNKTIGTECNNAEGYYDWEEVDGTITKKYMATACVDTATADGKKLFAGSTSYINKQKAEQYIKEYHLLSDFKYAKQAIKQKAEDIAKQVEIYLMSRPELTIKDLQDDEYFQKIAVQKVGETGYTSITDQDSSEQYFAGQKDMIGTKLSDFKKEIPVLWNFFKDNLLGKCNDAGIYYSWIDSNGDTRDKYAYSVCINVETADGKRLGIDASTYLDEFDKETINEISSTLGSDERLNFISEKINSKLENIESDLRFLSSLSEINDVVNDNQLWDNTVLTSVREIFKNFSTNKGIYYQIRYLDKFGNEKVRVDNIDGKTLLVSEENLQNKKGRYYFDDVIKLNRNDIYVSPLDLNLENTVLENRGTKNTPSYVPVIRYGTPVFDDSGEKSGIILLNIYADSILDILKEENSSSDFNTYLVDSKGYFLFNDDKSKEFGGIFGTNKTILSEFGEKFKDIFVNDFGSIKNEGKIFDYMKIFPSKSLGHNYFWVLITETNKAEENHIQSEISPQTKTFISDYNYDKYIFWFIAALTIFSSLLMIMYHFKILKVEKVSFIIILFFVFLIIVAMFVWGARSTVNQLKNQYKDALIMEHYQSENLLSDKITVVFSDLHSELKYASENISKIECNREDCSVLLRGMFERNKQYVYGAYRINSQNIIENVYPLDESLIGIDISGQAHVIKVKKTLKPVLSNVFKTAEGFLGIAFQYPVIKNGEFDGVFDFLIKVEDIFTKDAFLKNNSKGHEPYLMDVKGNIIFSVNNENRGRNIREIGKYKNLEKNLENIFKSEVAGETEFLEKNKKQILVYTPIMVEDNKLFLFIIGAEEDAYAGLNETLRNIWIFTLIALLLFGILGAFVSYFLNKTLKEEVISKTVKIRKNAVLIEEQLKKENENTKEKEKLIEKEKKAKKNLEKQIEDMEKFQKLTIDRELKMLELKKTINELKKKTSKP